MPVLHLQSKTDPDGNLRVAVGVPNVNVDLVIVIKEAGPSSPNSDAEWEQAVLAMEGSIDDPTFQRHPQGAFPAREPLQ